MTKSARPSLFGMNTKELETLATSLGQPKFRGRQIAKWMYEKNALDISDMTDLPNAFRELLVEKAEYYRSRVKAVDKSADGTAKYLLELSDGQTIESVLLPYEDRTSVCVSTQVGCPAGCAFCATGMSGFSRNLAAGEIVDEVLTLQREGCRRISHVVYMGMGEPLVNYDAVLKSIHLLNDEVGIAMRHITVSTVGVIERIRDLAQENLQITLAVSLHAPNDSLREGIIPLAKRFPIKDLMSACRYYTEETHRRITFEYLLINELNDSAECARELAVLLRGMLCNVNLIPYNAVEGLTFTRPPQSRVTEFRAVLESAGIEVTQRMERGHSVSAACGQLKRRKAGER